MAKPQTILKHTTFGFFQELHLALRAVSLRAFISKTQGDAIAHSVDGQTQFPVDVALAQRTPKGTVYVYLDGELSFQIDQRGAFSRPPRKVKALMEIPSAETL